MARFTKAERQKIVKDFAVRHNGHFNASLFVEEVRKAGSDHPAYGWFEWDKEKAVQEYHLWQARMFARDLKVAFTVENVSRDRPMTIRTVEMPMLLSPMAGRRDGGGYVLTDPENEDHMKELCRQAALSLDAFLRRYKSAIEHAGGSVAAVERQLKLLRSASPERVKEAA